MSPAEELENLNRADELVKAAGRMLQEAEKWLQVATINSATPTQRLLVRAARGHRWALEGYDGLLLMHRAFLCKQVYPKREG